MKKTIRSILSMALSVLLLLNSLTLTALAETNTYYGSVPTVGIGDQENEEWGRLTETGEHVTYVSPVFESKYLLTVKMAADGERMPGEISVPAPNQIGGSYQGKILAGANVTLTTAPVLPGYHFVNWTYDYGTVTDATSETITFTMPSRDAVVVANYEKDAPIQLVVTANSGAKVYNGSLHAISGYEITSGRLEQGHVLSGLSAKAGGINIGTYPSGLIGNPVVMQGTLDVSYMYQVTLVDGVLRIMEDTLLILPKDNQQEYNGEFHGAVGFTTEGLMAGHKVDEKTVKISGARRDVGSEPLTITEADLKKIRVYNVVGDRRIDVTENYTIGTVPGKATVTKKALSLIAGDGSHAYDGGSHDIAGGDVKLSTPLVRAQGLARGDELDLRGVTAEGGGVNAGGYATKAVVAKGAKKITIKRGNKDVTDNYQITHVTGTLTITKRPLFVTGGTDSKLYMGEKQTLTTFEAEGLIAGDYVDADTVSAYGEGTDVGSYAVNITSPVKGIKVKDRTGKDVTGNYEIGIGKGQLHITPQDLTITADTKSYVYNGTTQTVTTYTVAGLMGKDREDSATVKALGSGMDVATYDVKFTDEENIRIKNGTADVTRNYKITVVAGKMTITKRPLTIMAGTDEWTYTGYDQTMNFFTTNEPTESSGLATKHSVDGSTVRIQGTGRDVNETGYETSIVTLEGIVVLDGAGNDVTKNYQLSDARGKLTITPATLRLIAGSGSKEYSGEDHNINDAEFAPVYTAVGLLGGDAIADGTVAVTGNGVDAGEYATKVVNESGIRIVSPKGADAKGNYAIQPVDGKLTITKKHVTVYAGSGKKAYNGKPQFIYEFKHSKLVEGDYVAEETVEVTGSGMYVGDYTTEITDASDIHIKDKNHRDVTKNYHISKAPGNLKITQREIMVYAGTDRKVFNGADQTIDFFTTIEGGLVNGDEVDPDSVKLAGTGRNVNEDGYETSIVSGSDIKIKNGTMDVTENYKILTGTGVLTIAPKPVTIMAANSGLREVAGFNGGEQKINAVVKTKPVYMAESMANENQVTIYSGVSNLVTGQDLMAGTPRVEGKPQNADSLPAVLKNTGAIGVQNAKGGDEADHDTIKTVGEASKGSSQKITLTAGSLTKVYNGQEWVVDTYEVAGLQKDFTLGNVRVDTRQTDAGEYATEFIDSDGIQVFDSEGVDVTENYDIHLVPGKLTIAPREIWIIADDGNHVFDGSTWTVPTFHTRENDLAGSDYVVTDTVIVDGSGRDKGEYPTTIDENTKDDIRIKNGGADVTKNYSIVLKPGLLRITARPIEIKAESGIVTYDGTEHDIHKLCDEEARLAFTVTGLVGDDHVDADTVTVTGKGVNANTYTTDIADLGNIVILDKGGANATKNYNIGKATGQLIIEKKTIQVRAADGEADYDGASHSIVELCESQERPVPTFTATGMVGADAVDAATVTVAGSGRNAGDYPTTIENFGSIIVRDEQGEEVTDNYTVTPVNGTLRVKAKVLTIKAHSLTESYKGDAWTVMGYDVDGELGTGDALDLGSFTVRGSLTDVGETEVKIIEAKGGIKVKNGKTDVTGNYIIHTANGRLIVNPRELTLIADSETHIYNGEAFTVTGYTPDNIAPGEFIKPGTVKVTGSGRDAGEYDTDIQTLVGVKVLNGSKDVTGNYMIKKQSGKLVITKKTITITAAGGSATFDGMTHDINAVVGPKPVFTATGMVNGEEVDPNTVTVTGKGMNAGTIVTQVLAKHQGKVKVKNNGMNRTGNYDILFVPGELQIQKRTLVLAAASGSVEYDGLPHTIQEACGPEAPEIARFTTQNLIGNDYVDADSVTVIGTRTMVGETATEVTDLESIVVRNEDGTTSENYVIGTPAKGKLTITKRQVRITAGGGDYVFTGATFTAAGFSVEPGDMAAGDEVKGTTVAVTGSRRDVGETPTRLNKVSAIRIENNGVDVTANYEIVALPGAIRVTPMPIVLAAGKEAWEYNGATRTVRSFSLADGYALAAGDAVDPGTVTLSGSCKDVGTVQTLIQNKDAIKIRKGTKDVTSNYEIIGVLPGMLTITPRVLTVAAKTESRAYDGTVHVVSGFTASGLVGSDMVDESTVTVSGGRRNTGQTLTVVENEALIRVMNGSLDVTGNYTLVVKSGGLCVTPRPMAVASDTLSRFTGDLGPTLTEVE